VIVKYLAEKIISGELEYSFVIGKRPDLKVGIDAYLVENGHGDLIV
jgi:hypothetical protein